MTRHQKVLWITRDNCKSLRPLKSPCEATLGSTRRGGFRGRDATFAITSHVFSLFCRAMNSRVITGNGKVYLTLGHFFTSNRPFSILTHKNARCALLDPNMKDLPWNYHYRLKQQLLLITVAAQTGSFAARYYFGCYTSAWFSRLFPAPMILQCQPNLN